SPVAQPLSGWMKESLLFLSADTAEVEKVWLSALGMGAMEARVRNGKLTLTVPPALVAAGAPKTVEADLSGISVKVGGTGGVLDPYLEASVTPGPFDVVLGKASIVDNRIRVHYVIKRGSTLGSAA